MSDGHKTRRTRIQSAAQIRVVVVVAAAAVELGVVVVVGATPLAQLAERIVGLVPPAVDEAILVVVSNILPVNRTLVQSTTSSDNGIPALLLVVLAAGMG